MLRKFFLVFILLTLFSLSATIFAQTDNNFSQNCTTYGFYGIDNLYVVELLDYQTKRRSERCIAEDWIITGETGAIGSIKKESQQVMFVRLADGGINVMAKSGKQLTDHNYLFIKKNGDANKSNPTTLIEDTDEVSDIHPRWLLNGIALHPRLWRDPEDSTTRFLKFTIRVQYQGSEYDFSELSTNNVASLVCDFGVNARTGNAVYRDQENFVYAGTLPLFNNQEISTDILIKLPIQHKRLLTKNNNLCFVQLNNVIDGEDLTSAERDAVVDGVIKDSISLNYKIRMLKGTLRLTPR